MTIYDIIEEESINFDAKIALIIPFRNRDSELQEFLDHIHHFMKAQNASYWIYVIEQVDELPFNRGKLLNVGFKEANPDVDCFIFHDIDLLPLDLRNLYKCGDDPIHLTAHVDYFRYNLPYNYLMGGGISIRRRISSFSRL